jgi:membrane protease YdiL (CAAX protease family)
VGPVAVGGLTPARLTGWFAFVAAFSALSYAGRLLVEDQEGPNDTPYLYSSAIAATIQYAIVLGIALVLARHSDPRETFALRRPSSWARAGGITLLTLVAVFAATAVVAQFGSAGEEQGLTPEYWDPDRVGALIAFGVSVVLIGPVVEELMFRGVGFTLLAMRFGRIATIVLSGVLFALAHGLLLGFAVIAIFGIGLAALRA